MMRRYLAVAGACAAVAGGIVLSGAAEQHEQAAPAFEDADLRLRLDISERMLYVEADGERIETYNVAVGTDRHPTPRGSFTIERIIWNPRWVPPDSEWARDEKVREPGDPQNPMGRVKIFFREPDYYIHGTNAESSIGTAASHGCVRMLNSEVMELAQLLIDRSGTPVEPGLIKRLINRVRQTKELRLATAVPMVVED